MSNESATTAPRLKDLADSQRGRYDDLTRDQLVRLLEKRDRERKLGLVWERDELEADQALEGEFVAATPIAELHEGSSHWRNLVIEGDNYDALRWLRMTWAGRIKCIYVDPPYNTGNKDWVYNDHYFSNDDRFRHSTWLEFLYRRFSLARDLLTDDGVMLVSINDENRGKLELLLDEVLPGMRIGSLVWRTRNGSNADQVGFLSPDHEHVLVYANPSFSFVGTGKTYAAYDNVDNDPRGDWQAVSLKLGFNFKERPNLYYPLRDPQTDIYYPCSPDRVWVYASKDRLKPGQNLQTKPMEDFVADKQIIFPADQRVECYNSLDALYAAIDTGDVPESSGIPVLRRGLPEIEQWVGRRIGFGTPRRKLFKEELRRTTQPLSSWIAWKGSAEAVEGTLIAGSNTEGSRSVREVFGEKTFNFAKPPSLIRGLVEQATQPGDIVLDFFAGSATTAQAVMSANAQDSGDRRFIMVSSTEATQDEPTKNLCREITAERIRRLNASDEPGYAPLSAEFAYLRCRKLRFEDLDYEDGLTPSETWAALESVHQLPLTPYMPAPWTTHETDAVAIVYVDRFAGDLIPWLRERSKARKPTFVYSWAPGQIRDRLDGAEVEVRSVHDTLVARFRQ